MNKHFRNILALIAGWIGGSIINLGLIEIGHALFPLGIDTNDMEAMAQAMPELGFQFFIFPFLAHALGTFTGAFIAAALVTKNKMRFALIIGVLFFIGGSMMNYMLQGPIWFTLIDLVFAYLPMAWIGGTLAKNISGKK